MPTFYKYLYGAEDYFDTTKTRRKFIMTTNSNKAIEFYDEELSRTLRQIQELLANEPSNPQLDKLFTNAAAYLNQMMTIHRQAFKKSKDSSIANEYQQWKEIIQFRQQTFQTLQQSVHTVEFEN